MKQKGERMGKPRAKPTASRSLLIRMLLSWRSPGIVVLSVAGPGLTRWKSIAHLSPHLPIYFGFMFFIRLHCWSSEPLKTWVSLWRGSSSNKEQGHLDDGHPEIR